jgi:fatty-acid peroxygenase
MKITRSASAVPITVPRLTVPDCTLSILMEGYEFVPRRMRRFHSDLFCGRMMGEPVIFMSGPESARVFYDAERFRRSDAVPRLVQKTLFGTGGVQGLDNAAHGQRKALFMSLMSKENLARFLSLAQSEWDAAIAAWQARPQVTLLEEAELLMCRAALRWAGLPTTGSEAKSIARDCAAMFSGFATVGPRCWRARVARLRREAWARGVLRDVQRGVIETAPDSAARVFTEPLPASGERLPLEVAAVELLNIVRPITALGVWIAFMAVALRDHPRHRERLRSDAALVEAFVHEVRRFYPFTPFVGARVQKRFVWRGAAFEEGMLAILDVYGSLRDPRIWDNPDEFRPERFLDFTPGPFDYIPQGGGDFGGGHRCAGEWLTIEALKQALNVLTRTIRYELPAQDLGYALHTVPTAPRSGVILQHVERAETATTSFDPGRVRGGDSGQAVH